MNGVAKSPAKLAAHLIAALACLGTAVQARATTIPVRGPTAAIVAVDTFEVAVQQNPTFRIAADRVEHRQMGLILLEADGAIVAAIQQHQIVYVVNISEPASGRFEIQTYNNETFTIPGDALAPDASGLIRIMGPNGTMGYISNSQLRYVVAADAKRTAI